MQRVAFDLGNVLIDLHWDGFWETIKPMFSMQERAEIKYILEKESHIDFCGLTVLSDVLEKRYGKEVGQAVTDAWNKIVKPNNQMVNFVNKLKSEGFKVAFLSNMGFDHLNYLNKEYPDFMKLADVKHMSCEVGAAKPSLLYYQSFLMSNEDFSGCLYLDDLKDNLKMGSKVRFDSMHFDLNDYNKDKPSDLKKQLDKIHDKLLLHC